MTWTDIAEIAKSFGVAGAILAVLGFAAWRIGQRLMPKMETAFDRHNTLVETLSSAVNQIVSAVNQIMLSIATLTQHAANHADKLDTLTEAVKKLQDRMTK